MESKNNYEMIVLRKKVHWITRLGGLKGCCVLVFDLRCLLLGLGVVLQHPRR